MAAKSDGLYKRGQIWWIRTDPVHGKPQSTYCRDKEAARLYRAKRERLAADPAHAAAETARLDEWIRRVIATKESDGSASATVEVYRTKLGHWLRFAPDALLSEVDPNFVDAFVALRRTEQVTDHTISKEYVHLTTVLKAAKRAGCYPGEIDRLRPPGLHAGYKPRKRTLSREQVAALLSECSPWMGALVRVCVALGCRLSEALRLEPGDIGADKAHIRGTKTEGSDRYVPIYSIYRALLAGAVPALPLGPEPLNLRRDMARACKRAGIAVCTPNDLRRTHGTLLIEAGVDRDVVRRGFGHVDTRMVDLVYGQPSTEALGALAETKLLTAAPLTESPRHVAPEGDGENGHDSGFRMGDQGAEGGAHGSPSRLERQGDAPVLGGLSGVCDQGLKERASVRETVRAGDLHVHRTGQTPAGLACEPGRHVGNGLGDRREPVTLQIRDSEPGPTTAPSGKHRADFEIRTRDLRFTKPVQAAAAGTEIELLSVLRRKYTLLSAAELLRSGAIDDRKPRVTVTDPLQLRGAL